MKHFTQRTSNPLSVCWLLAFAISACAVHPALRDGEKSGPIRFGAEISLGDRNANPSTPFLRYAPDGRLFAVWPEDHETPWPQAQAAEHHGASGKMAPSPIRNVYLAWSADAGKSWSVPARVNRAVEAAQGEENGPKVAFDMGNRARLVWSIPGERGDKTRANIRFAMEVATGEFTPARTLNEVKDAARFSIIEPRLTAIFWLPGLTAVSINPNHALYLMKIGADGKALTKNYQAGELLCDCCKLGIVFDDGRPPVGRPCTRSSQQ